MSFSTRHGVFQQCCQKQTDKENACCDAAAPQAASSDPDGLSYPANSVVLLYPDCTDPAPVGPPVSSSPAVPSGSVRERALVAVPRGRLHREACTHRGTGSGGGGDLGARAVRAKRIAARTPAQRAYFNRSSNGLYYTVTGARSVYISIRNGQQKTCKHASDSSPTNCSRSCWR